MKRNMMIGAVVVTALSMASLSMATVYTWTGVNNDWTNTVNWDVNGVPATTGASNYVGGADNNIVINGGGEQPSVNIPGMAQGALGESPKVTLGANASLALQWGAGASWNGMKGTGTMATVGSGATLEYTLDNYIGYASLARDPSGLPLQTYNVNGGDLVFNHGGRLDLAFGADRTSLINLDGGDVIFDHRYGSTTSAPFMECWGYGNDPGSATNYSSIILNNGSTFGTVRMKRAKWASGNPAMVFDIQDTNSVVKIYLYDDGYATLDAVTNDFGSVFTCSTFGDAYLQATETDGIVTVSVMSGAPVTSPFEIWLSGYSVGAFTAPSDDAENGGIGDGLDNLTEYALGSAPDVVDVPADVLPISVVDGAVLNYIYQRQNPKDPNLTYTVLDGTDLVAGLVNTNTTDTASGVIVNGYETVTNHVSTAVEGQQFMKLNLELSD